VNVLRDAMAVDSLDECGIYFGTTGGQVYASANAGDTWEPIVRDLPPVLSVEVQTLDCMVTERAVTEIRVVLPGHLRALAKVAGEVRVQAAEPVTIAAVLDAIEGRFPVLRGAIRDHDAGPRRPFVRFFACEQDLSHDPVDTPVPAPVAAGTEPFLVIGSVAGG
jgi:hypothetical protein